MNKSLLTLLVLFANTFMFCRPLTAQTIISGPSVRVSGISTPTVVRMSPVQHNNPRWTKDRAEVGHSLTLSVTEPGTYEAWDVEISSIPGEPDLESWFPNGSITIPALEHSISVTGPNPLDLNAATTLTINSNASAVYGMSIKWYRGFFEDGNTAISRAVAIPGAYTATIQYSYGTETAATSVGSAFIDPYVFAPTVPLPVDTYNPVTPPVLRFNNAFFYARYNIYLNNNLIATRAFNTFEVPQPGLYRIEGITPLNKVISTGDFFVFQGNIPAPTIIASTTVLTYAYPSLVIFTQVGYNSGYTWYLNGQPIPDNDGVGNNLTITKTGSYSVKGCAVYPDGTSQCKTSQPVQITGEILYVNHVTKKTSLVDDVSTEDQLNSLDDTHSIVTTSYLDDLARPIQVVQQAASPTKKDITTLHVYDQFGREAKQYLPFARSSGDGGFVYTPPSLKPLFDFYQADNDKIANTSVPFGETRFEASPLNRTLRQGAPGEDWQLNQLSASHDKRFNYSANSLGDNIWIWIPDAQGMSASAFYPDGSLAVVESTDENGHLSREFKDKFGHSVLTEKEIEGGVKLRTYFIFDDLGRLTNVIPPLTTSSLAVTPSATIANDVLARECYSYDYDERGRVIVRNIPGSGLQYVIYDQWDRIVLTQHSNQRTKNRWSFNKYDALNRPVMTGEITLAGDNVAAKNAITSFYASVSGNPSLRYEEPGGNIHGYTNRSFPILTNDVQAYSISYYDNYNFLPQFGTAYQFASETSLGLSSNSSYTQNLITGLKTIVLGSNSYLKTVHFYDDKHRLIQIVSDNHLGGVDRTSSQLDFVGKILRIKDVHRGLQTITTDEEFTYDAIGRKLQVFHTANGGPRILLCDYRYNELGQLVEKNLHSTDGNTFLQSLDYRYNIRNWLTQVNPTENESNVTFQDQYGFELVYTSAFGGGPGFHSQFNGNIAMFSEARPSNFDAGGSFRSVYSYTYDDRDQLVGASYFQPSDPTQNGSFDMPTITYDSNGNISTLKRYSGIGLDGTPTLIDNLNYFYNGNQLIRVDDSADLTKGFIKK